MSIPTDVRDAVVSAYYGRVMSSSESARSRAQAGYGIASAIALGVVAAGLFGRLHDRPAAVQVAAVAALISWLIAAALFLHTVSSSFEMGLQSQSSEDAFVGAALAAVREERRMIDAWQRKAQLASALAAIVTVVTFVAALRTEDSPTTRAATMTMTAAGAAALNTACGRIPAMLTGKVSEDSLRQRFLKIALAPGMCGPKSVEVAIRRSQVLALVFR